MTPRENRFAIWNFEAPDCFQVPKCYFWKETIERWHGEGLPEGEDPNGHEGILSEDNEAIPVDAGFSPLFELKILDRDEDYVVLTDEYGIKKKVRAEDFERTSGLMKNAGDSSSMAQWLEFPVRNRADWEKIREERLVPSLDHRLPENWREQKTRLLDEQSRKILKIYDFPLLGTFGAVRQLMGYENMVFAMQDDPKLVRMIADDLSAFWISLFSQLFQQVKADWFVFFEDMCSTKAPLISPRAFLEFFGDAYRDMCGFLRQNGVSCVEIDSDGDCRKMIGTWQQLGINSISPCQVQAGMDAAGLRAEFPRLLLRGGIDKTALAKGKDAIDEELSRRFRTAWRERGYLPEIDHLIPYDVSWDNFRYFVEKYRFYGSRPIC
jgi:hypothetical protein